jgi:hypothetical protein
VSTRPPQRRASSKPAAPRAARPSRKQAAVASGSAAASGSGGEQLDAAILRFLRRFPNRAVDLAPLAEELGVQPFEVQLTVQRLARRRLLTPPFIEPGTAGGGELTQAGLRWLVAYEGGKPRDVPTALKPATERVRAEDEAARLPRAEVYGTR